jgi:hypothetical protein
MEIFYGNRLIGNNVFLTVSSTQNKPIIILNVNPNKFYTLIMYDPNAINGTYIHWIEANITGNEIKTGYTILPYKGPSPPPNTGIHHYIFELYEQHGLNELGKINSRIFSINEIRKKLSISNPIYKIQFISKNQSGGKNKRHTKTKKRVKNSRKSSFVRSIKNMFNLRFPNVI